MCCAIEISLNNQLFTNHAKERMFARGFEANTIDIVLAFGRKIYSRGALFYVIGKKEIQRFQDKEPLIKHMEGIQVVASTSDDAIITVYRSKDLRSIRPTCHKHRHHH